MSAGRGSAPAMREVRLPSSPAPAARARGFVVETLRGWQVEDTALDDAELIVSELVTNAFLHGRAADVVVILADRGADVRLEVVHREAEPDRPTTLVPLTVSAQETHGRGLAIVDVLSEAWGVDEADGERRVWADLVASRAGLLPAPSRDGALGRLTAAVALARDARGVGDAVTDWARSLLATAFAGIALADDDPGAGPGHLRYLSVEPLPRGSAEHWARFPVDTDAPVAAAYREARPYFHESRTAAVAGFPSLGPALEQSQLVALAHLPLLDHDRPVGTLALAWSHGRELDADDRGWLEAVAAVAAAAIVRTTPPAADGGTSP